MSSASPRVAWFYGLPGAGKTTLAQTTAATWRAEGRNVVLLDGDDVRSGLCRDLGFTTEDRTENIRRTAEMAALLCGQGFDVVAALITPLRQHRDLVRDILRDYSLTLHWVNCPVEVCLKRDPKGIYTRAASNEMKNVTGWDAPFEEPVE